MSTIGCDIESLTFFKKEFKQPDLNDLALWILQVCYDQYNPLPIEVSRVKKELTKIYIYEGIKF